MILMVSRDFEKAASQSVHSSARNPLLAAGHWHMRSELPKGGSDLVGLTSRYTRQHVLSTSSKVQLNSTSNSAYFHSTLL